MSDFDGNGALTGRRVTRRSVLRTAATALALPAIIRTTTAYAQDKRGTGSVVVFSYGGNWTKGMREKLFDPFTEATGITVTDVTADFAEAQVKAMNGAGRVDWDLAYIDAYAYPGMSSAGFFEPIDYSLWDAEALNGVPEANRLNDAVVGYESTTMLAYSKRAFPNGGPENWAEFWDQNSFAGPRGLMAVHGKHNMVFALSADGVAPGEIWPLTDDKIDRALQKLDQVKPHISKWWTAGGEPIQLLVNGEYTATSAPFGRVLGAIRDNVPLQMVWDGANRAYVYWSILKGGPNTGNAQKLLAFANRANIAAGLVLGIGAPGPNKNQLEFLPPELRQMLSINPDNASKTILEDSAWIAEKRPDGKTNADHILDRWREWRTE